MMQVTVSRKKVHEVGYLVREIGKPPNECTILLQVKVAPDVQVRLYMENSVESGGQQ